METSNKTAREIYQEVKSNPARKRFGFGNKAVLVNIDPQKAYTRTDLFATAYETDRVSLSTSTCSRPDSARCTGRWYGLT